MRELSADLSEEERRLLLEHGEEAPFCGVFLHEERKGLYTCRLCGLPLFKAGAKFESGTGWPSFTAPVGQDHLRSIRDTRYGMVRTESFALAAARTKVMSFRTARLRPGNAFA